VICTSVALSPNGRILASSGEDQNHPGCGCPRQHLLESPQGTRMGLFSLALVQNAIPAISTGPIFGQWYCDETIKPESK